MKVSQVPIDRVIPYARNPRKNEAAVAKVAASIKEYGWRQPIVVDAEFVIIAGHTRLLAARQLQLPKVPVHVAEGLSEAQVKAYRLADNRTHEDSEWDDELLSLELAELLESDFDLSLTGFDDDELEQLLKHGSVGLTDPDAAPDAPEHPVSRRGDVWLLGQHRLMCGDSTAAECVEVLLANQLPHLMVTDPPYGVEYDPAWRKQAGLNAEGNTAVGKVLNDDRADWSEAWQWFPGTIAYIWHSPLHCAAVHSSLATFRFRARAHIVWVKTSLKLSRGHYHWQHEECLYTVRDDADEQWHFVPEHEVALYAVKDNATGQWHGNRKQSTVWFIENLKNDTGHGTQKPVECMRRPMENNSSPGQLVYDPFVGSGTSIIAAETTGRICLAMELSPGYVDVAVKRWQAFTGREAMHAVDGGSFATVAAQREVLAANEIGVKSLSSSSS